MLSKYHHNFGLKYLFIYNKIKRKVMAHYKYKNKITDDVVDAREIILSVGRALNSGNIDKASALTNLAEAIKKLESALYYIDRE
jgi:hypothetical protein